MKLTINLNYLKILALLSYILCVIVESPLSFLSHALLLIFLIQATGSMILSFLLWACKKQLNKIPNLSQKMNLKHFYLYIILDIACIFVLNTANKLDLFVLVLIVISIIFGNINKLLIRKL